MPHSSRRGKKSSSAQNTKSRNVDLGDGWTVVTRGIRRLSSAVRNPLRKASDAKSGVEGEVGEPDDTVAPEPEDVGELIRRFEKLRDRWRGLPYRQILLDLLDSIWQHGSREEPGCQERRIDNAVCIAIGSFSTDWLGAEQTSLRSLWQLVLFLEIMEYLQRNTHAEKNMKVYAQEPLFSALDKAFLAKFEIQTLDSPHAVELITPSTFLFVPFLEWYVLLWEVLRCKDPELYIGTDIHDILDRLDGLAEEDDRVASRATDGDGTKTKVEELKNVCAEFFKSRELVQIPDEGVFEGHATALYGLVIYTRAVDEGHDNT
ncbi:hypothetical protein NA57DRAFT_70420 [Rhizodiscina lignyota]|uniref:SRR1-like domain-containing protein n=1 Tax=Rhizodiscina lignyota TaxID=1504668 RepID=A0A9P4MAN3_9PEZI|nr:hypothetical protein NA57DRAFT_70420 [Rhizodiscina lignyota]